MENRESNTQQLLLPSNTDHPVANHTKEEDEPPVSVNPSSNESKSVAPVATVSQIQSLPVKQQPTGSNPTDGSGVSPMMMSMQQQGTLKRKRGRPRKYTEGGHPPVLIMGSGSSPPPVSGLSAISGLPSSTGMSSLSGTGMALALAPLAASTPPHLGFVGSPGSPGPPSSERKRGRPPGSGKKQQLAALGAWLAGSAGQGFTPHIITIAAGEDVATKIIQFAQIGPRATCVLSANGAISNVTLRQPATSGGTVTYEGRFEMLSLSGSFLLTENNGTRSRTGGLSVALAGPDGRVIGGSVAGLLIAATPVQVVVGSFIAETRTPKPVQVRTNSGASSDALAANSPRPSGLSSPLNDTNNNNNNNNNAWSNEENIHQHQHQHQNQNQNLNQNPHQNQNQNIQQNQSSGHGTDINILPSS